MTQEYQRQLQDPGMRTFAGGVDESYAHRRGVFLLVFLDVLGPRAFAAANRSKPGWTEPADDAASFPGKNELLSQRQLAMLDKLLADDGVQARAGTRNRVFR